jgi:FlaA1/EpsC-like NDP-sugar epimerase
VNRPRFLGILRVVQIGLDVVVLSAALWLSFLLRFEGQVPYQMLKRALLLWPYLTGVQYVALAALGVPRFSWRYVGLREAVRILIATGAVAILLAAARVIAATALEGRAWAQYVHLPLGVVTIDFFLAFMGVVGVRVCRRLFIERRVTQQEVITPAEPTLLIGAGHGGLLVAKEISRRPSLGISAAGFIDDDPRTHGTLVHGIRVLGAVRDVHRIAHERGIKQAVITISTAPGPVMRSIADACQKAGLRVKVVPGLHQIVGGEMKLTRIRDVAIEDLLRRDPIVLDDAAVAADLKGSVVMVTGAGGSIGSELCRQVALFGPRRLLLVERAENALFEIHRELREMFPDLAVVPLIADVAESARVTQIFRHYRPQVVFHAAAHKHVPMMEWNPAEAIKNNVIGTRTLADIAHAHETRSFVMISTDKAVNPTSVMGASKRAAEIYVQALANRSTTRFVTVRFGNVLGSNGSVVPIFKEQIERGGPVTVTHPDMKRYFMTIPEACQLVLQAGAMGRGGEIFILDMGEPVRIVDLARDLIHLSGFTEQEIPIVFSGVRPGEKLYEELSVADEKAQKTQHPKIFIGRTTAAPYDIAATKVETLRAAVEEGGDPKKIRTSLAAFVPEYVTPAVGPGDDEGPVPQSLPPPARALA